MKTSNLVLLATAALLVTPTFLSALQTGAAPQTALDNNSGLYLSTTRGSTAVLTSKALLLPSLQFNPAQALSVSTSTAPETLAAASDRPDQAVTPTHDRTVVPGESVHIVNTIENRAVTITITIDVTVGEGATVDIDKDVHPPHGQISMPVVTPNLD